MKQRGIFTKLDWNIEYELDYNMTHNLKFIKSDKNTQIKVETNESDNINNHEMKPELISAIINDMKINSTDSEDSDCDLKLDPNISLSDASSARSKHSRHAQVIDFGQNSSTFLFSDDSKTDININDFNLMEQELIEES
eukprot:172794_1